eukprot:scaffold90063_cov15-Tisochrysis_lutea.AAC.1
MVQRRFFLKSSFTPPLVRAVATSHPGSLTDEVSHISQVNSAQSISFLSGSIAPPHKRAVAPSHPEPQTNGVSFVSNWFLSGSITPPHELAVAPSHPDPCVKNLGLFAPGATPLRLAAGLCYPGFQHHSYSGQAQSHGPLLSPFL